MFCSASHEGAKKKSTYPQRPTKRLFRIGGADSTGNLYGPVGDLHNIDYTVPRELVQNETFVDGVQIRLNGSQALLWPLISLLVLPR
jgi:hypothetical protein